ncbi:MAG: GntR family transcriptional regulator [Eubacteriales bacterium]|nr:GntR family transcriptional regulator [Eubacteriales bacterium]
MIIINYNDKRPIYEQVVDRMQALILSGALEPDEKLPSVRALAMELSINPNTIQKAYHELEAAGYIYTVIGRGNFVRDNDSLIKVKREHVLNELKVKILSCKEAGVSETEVRGMVETIFGRGENND